MAWIELHQSLRDHRKLIDLADRLGLPEPHAAGHVTFLWLWALDNADEGRIPDNPRVIERAAGWTGEAGAFFAAMVDAGFLDRDDEPGVAIHDWDAYAGKLIDRRAANAARMREARAKHQPDTKETRATHVQRTSRARVELPNQTVPNQTVPNHDHPPTPSSHGASSPSRLETILDGTFAPISAKFTGVDETLSASWLRKVLTEADALAPSIGVDDLRAALKEALAGIKRAMTTADDAHPIRHPQGFTKKLIIEAVAGRSERPHA